MRDLPKFNNTTLWLLSEGDTTMKCKNKNFLRISQKKLTKINRFRVKKNKIYLINEYF